MSKSLREFVELVIERQVRQARLSGDRTAEWGSEEHISDLEARCADAAYWRDAHPRGSEKRGHYKNVLTHLKRELQSAKKRNQINEKQKVEE
jgi:hypothetical protein